MKLASILTASICISAFAGTVQWNFSLSTGGEDINWVSSSAAADASTYDTVMSSKIDSI